MIFFSDCYSPLFSLDDTSVGLPEANGFILAGAIRAVVIAGVGRRLAAVVAFGVTFVDHLITGASWTPD